MVGKELLKILNSKKAKENRLYEEINTVDSKYFKTKEGEDLDRYVSSISENVKLGLDQSISILTPWFFKNMPKIYYQTTPRSEKIRHLSSIITGNIFEAKQTVELWNSDKTQVTFIGPGGDQSIVFDITNKVKNLSLKLGFLYFSKDHLLFVATFFKSNYKEVDLKNNYNNEKIKLTKKILQKTTSKSLSDKFLYQLDNDFVKYATEKRLALNFKMLSRMLKQEGAHTFAEKIPEKGILKLTLGLKSVPIDSILEDAVRIIDRYGYSLMRFFVSSFDKHYLEEICIFHFVLKYTSNKKKLDESIAEVKLTKALKTLSWIDVDDYSDFTKTPFHLSINASNFIRAVASWVNILLGKENIYYYSDHMIHKTFVENVNITLYLVDLFSVRFSPLREKDRSNNVYQKIRKKIFLLIGSKIDRIVKKIFTECVNFTDNILKTNYFLPTKTGLAFRMNPDVLDSTYYPNRPYGIFFIVGKDYRFFHVRWKDVARGGVRVVIPKNSADYDYAISGLFDEVYGLSHAQQLKNKDIPEGGSKGVLVVQPGSRYKRSVRYTINALLDLLLMKEEFSDPRFQKQVNYYPNEEIIYLGPDENITNDLIDWIQNHSERRGFQYARSFMSSKPDEGINHKEFGVTSEGLHVYVQHVLKYLKIDSQKSDFTVIMTGGPDGDVAGNELKLLYKSYGKNCKVIAIADGGGAAFDSSGLNWEELLKLVKNEQSIVNFDKRKLSKKKSSFVIDVSTSSNLIKRNNLPFTVKADLFIPAGGRPYSVNEKNMGKFIHNDKPNCRAVIEGANIYFTTKAREFLESKGVIMIKDSSANKTGVICSSFEVLSSHVLDKKDYLSIKTKYVKEVIDILKIKANAEAKLLFKEFKKPQNEKSLSQLSLDISSVINNLTDLLLESFYKNEKKILDNSLNRKLILKYCPPVLQDQFSSRIKSKIPKNHQIAMLASRCASYVVYKEGLDWAYSFKKEKRVEAIMTYMKNDEIANSLVDTINNTDLLKKKSIASVLMKSGANNLTQLELDKEK